MDRAVIEAKAVWQGKMAFIGSASTEYTIPLDASAKVGGEGKGLLPIELLAIGLAGCTGMDVISILQKKRVHLTGFEVRVHVERANEHPRVFTHIHVEYEFTGHHLDRKAIEQAVSLSEGKYCSVSAMFRKTAEIVSTIVVRDAESGSE